MGRKQTDLTPWVSSLGLFKPPHCWLPNEKRLKAALIHLEVSPEMHTDGHSSAHGHFHTASMECEIIQ